MSKQLLTHSRMQAFKTCRKRHLWAYEYGFRREVDAKALRIGTAIHSALDVLKRGGEASSAIDAVVEQYRTCPESVDEDDWRIEQETVENLVVGYDWRWGSGCGLEVVATEWAFVLPLLNPATNANSKLWMLAGKIDGIVVLEDGRQAVLEHKTTSDDLAPDSDYWTRLQLDNQISLYVWAARQAGYDVSCVLYDVIRKPAIKATDVPVLDEDGLKIVLDGEGNRVYNKPKKKADLEAGVQGPPRQTADAKLGYALQTRPMSVEEWSDKVLDDLERRPEWYYARREIARLDQDIDLLLDELWQVQLTIRDAQLHERHFMTVSRDTCGFCPYFSLCSSKFDPTAGDVPEGFIQVENVHPELGDSTDAEGTHEIAEEAV